MGSHNYLQYLCQNMLLPGIPAFLPVSARSPPAVKTNIPGSFLPGMAYGLIGAMGSSRTTYGGAAISQA